MTKRNSTIVEKINAMLEDESADIEKVSARGKLAYKVVKITSHLPEIGPANQNGELRKIKTEHEKKWVCPQGYKLRKHHMKNFTMDVLEKLGDVEVFGEEAGAAQSAAEDEESGYILQLHGGGYYGTFNNTYRDMAVCYSIVSGGMVVISPDYRVAPVNPYPAALEDAFEAYKWIMKKIDKREKESGKRLKLIVAGDSAGGGLSLALTLYLKENNLRLPDGIITMSAWTDLTKSGASYDDNYKTDPLFGGSRETLVYKEGYYAGSDPKDPHISPCFADYTGFPKMLMQVGEYEMLLSDSQRVYVKAIEAGATCRLHIYPGMFHEFQMGIGLYPEAGMAWREIREWIGKLE